MLSAAICLAMGSSTWRLIQTKVLSSSSSFLSKSFCGMLQQLGDLLELGLARRGRCARCPREWPRCWAPPRWRPAAARCGRGCGRGWPAAPACARSAPRPGAGRSRCRAPARRPRGPASTTKPSAIAGDDELAAPDRRLAREQGAGRVLHAAAAAGSSAAPSRAVPAGAGLPVAAAAGAGTARDHRAVGAHVLRDGRRGGAHLELLLGQLLDPQRRGLGALLDLQAVAVEPRGGAPRRAAIAVAAR